MGIKAKTEIQGFTFVPDMVDTTEANALEFAKFFHQLTVRHLEWSPKKITLEIEKASDYPFGGASAEYDIRVIEVLSCEHVPPRSYFTEYRDPTPPPMPYPPATSSPAPTSADRAAAEYSAMIDEPTEKKS